MISSNSYFLFYTLIISYLFSFLSPTLFLTLPLSLSLLLSLSLCLFLSLYLYLSVSLSSFHFYVLSAALGAWGPTCPV